MKLKKNQTVYLWCLINTVIVCIFFAHTLNYGWKFYDEGIIYEEKILPIPASFSEIFEILRLFGIHNHFEAANTFYSNISNIRGTPLDVIFNLFILFFFKKSAPCYHLFSLSLHIVNTVICFFIINKISLNFNFTLFNRYFLISALTLLWSLHPVNVESVLFATNYGALVTYLFCFAFVFYFVNRTDDIPKKLNINHCIILFLLYLFPLFLNEYSVTLTFVLFSYIFATNIFNKKMSLKSAFLISLKKLSPLLFGLFAYFIYFLSFPGTRTSPESSLNITLERILWFSPQVFLHYLKLIFFPLKLSIDQGAFVRFSSSILGLYSLLSAILLFSLMIISIISGFYLRKRIHYFIFILIIPFFLSLLPFLHILSPIYNIASERYLYFPLFLLIFSFSHIIFLVFSKLKNKVIITSFIAFLVMLYGIRSYARTLDWKDNFTLLMSTVKTAPNLLYKGLRQQMISVSIKVLKQNENTEDLEIYNKLAIKSLEKALDNFNSEKTNLKNKSPSVLRFYGLDPKTLAAKTAYLLAHCKYEKDGDINEVLKIYSPYINDLDVLDTNILNFHYRNLFITKNIDVAENILKKNLKQNRNSPQLFVALSDLYEYKYNDLKSTEKYLMISFQYFPFDSFTLYGLKRLYQNINIPEKFAKYSYMYGLRTHDIGSLQQAALVYIALNKKQEAAKILKKLLRDYPIDEYTLAIQSRI